MTTTNTAGRGERSLDGIGLLSSIPEDKRDALAGRCSWRRFQPGEQIIDRQSDDRETCFVVEGAVRVVIHSLSGREVAFDDVTAGGFFGELAAIDEGPRSATVVATAPSLVAFMNPDTFREVLASYPLVTLSVLRRLTTIVRASTARILDLSTLGANNRVHAELLRLGRDAAAATSATPAVIEDTLDGEVDITPFPIHADIAARVSVTRETVARVVSDLNKKGLVRKTPGGMRITDYAALRRMVDEVRGE